MKARPKLYNDGYIEIYEQGKEKSSFGATLNTSDLRDAKKIVKLAYSERSRRAEDLEWAQARDRTLSLKVCCPMFFAVKTAHQAVCLDTLYSVINVDYDRAQNEMYLYLEEVRKLEQYTG